MRDFVLPPFDKSCNCTYTTGEQQQQVKVSIAALFKLMESIPKIPRILTMPIQLIRSPILTDNSILISNDIATALEEALKNGKTPPNQSSKIQ